MASNVITAFFDGACEWYFDPLIQENRRNPGGIATYGWLMYRDSVWIARGYGEALRGEGATNNVAEYIALISLLTAYTDLGLLDPVHIFGDSQLVIRQLSGRYQVRSRNLKPLYEKVKALILPAMVFEWVPREENTAADELSRRAYTRSRSGGAVGPWEVRAKNKY